MAENQKLAADIFPSVVLLRRKLRHGRQNIPLKTRSSTIEKGTPKRLTYTPTGNGWVTTPAATMPTIISINPGNTATSAVESAVATYGTWAVEDPASSGSDLLDGASRPMMSATSMVGYGIPTIS